MPDDILEAWRTNNRISLFLIDKISAPGMRCTLSQRGGRGVAGQFAHMHNNRVWQLEKRAKELAEGLEIFPPTTQPTKAALKKAFIASGNAIETFLTDLTAVAPKRRGFKKGVPSTLAYFVAHESHHRGIILLTLKECGHNLDKDARYAIWGMWDKT
ncbi:MAG: hypothetical protein O7E49_03515 [Gemmatimonadetes bacterium]|nr:hypothetical protein [Gemmatimonadota bacterium]